jgi:uncharacterized membrane protein YjjP (DUF1212 family)
MTLKDLGLNNGHYLHKAFDPQLREKLIRAARLRRNVYLVLFFIGIVCIFIAGFSGWATLSCLSLFLATLSLVVVTKYDTQVFFLKIIAEKEEPEA